MALTSGRDYLFFEKVDCTKQSLTATVTRGAVVMTSNLIAMIPVHGFGSIGVASIGTKHSLGGGHPIDGVKAMLADPAMDVPTLEAKLSELYARSDTRWLFPLAEAEKFKMSTGFFGMTSLKMQGESVRRIVIRDKGGKASAKSFYAARLAT